jgi:hypothetical protein
MYGGSIFSVRRNPYLKASIEGSREPVFAA